MINRILMELYDEYEKGNINALREFTLKTLPNDGTADLFIGCVMVMFKTACGYKPRYDCTREYLLSIVFAIKENIADTNYLAFWLDRINSIKGIHKYLDKPLSSPDLEKHTDLIIDYLEQFKPDFIRYINSYQNIKEKYIKKIEKEVKNKGK